MSIIVAKGSSHSDLHMYYGGTYVLWESNNAIDGGNSHVIKVLEIDGRTVTVERWRGTHPLENFTMSLKDFKTRCTVFFTTPTYTNVSDKGTPYALYASRSPNRTVKKSFTWEGMVLTPVDGDVLRLVLLNRGLYNMERRLRAGLTDKPPIDSLLHPSVTPLHTALRQLVNGEVFSAAITHNFAIGINLLSTSTKTVKVFCKQHYIGDITLPTARDDQHTFTFIAKHPEYVSLFFREVIEPAVQSSHNDEVQVNEFSETSVCLRVA